MANPCGKRSFANGRNTWAWRRKKRWSWRGGKGLSVSGFAGRSRRFSLGEKRIDDVRGEAVRGEFGTNLGRGQTMQFGLVGQQSQPNRVVRAQLLHEFNLRFV